MKDIAAFGKIEDDALIPCLIDGIDENNIIWCQNMSQFKDKLKCFGTVIAEENQCEKDKSKHNENSEKEKHKKSDVHQKREKKVEMLQLWFKRACTE